MAKKKKKVVHRTKALPKALQGKAELIPRASKRTARAPGKPLPSLKNSPGGISSAAVEKATGKGWSEWCRLLDRDGAKKMPHKDIAQLVHEKYDVGDWWCQMVTVGYEQARGLRKPHETPRGFQTSASKTVNVPIAELFDFWSHDFLRATWFDQGALNIRKETRDKSMRVSWPDGTHVEINFYSKGSRKSQVAVQHRKLKSSKDVARMKKFWGDALNRLKVQLG